MSIVTKEQSIDNTMIYFCFAVTGPPQTRLIFETGNFEAVDKALEPILQFADNDARFSDINQ